MDLFIDQLLSSIAKILVMLLLPLIWWLVTARKAQNFFSWIGLKQIQTEKKRALLLWFFGAAAACGRLHPPEPGDPCAEQSDRRNVCSVCCAVNAKAFFFPRTHYYAQINHLRSENDRLSQNSGICFPDRL